MSTYRTRRATAIAVAALSAALAVPATAAAPASSDAFTVVGLTEDGTALVTFPADKPQRTSDPVAIAGLAAGETVVGIDRRPRTDELFAVTSASRLLVVDESTGAAVQRSVLSVPLAGQRFGVDFNPTVDRLRIVSDAEQNLRVNVDTGAALVDGALAYAPGDPNSGVDPTVAGAAYTNNDSDFVGMAGMGTGTTLYDIDAALGTLVLQNPPNAGTLVTIGDLGQDDYRSVGFDIFSDTVSGTAVDNTAYAVLGKGGTEKLYTVDLTSGETTLVGPFGSQGIADLAVPLG